MISHRFLACLLIVALLGVAGCIPHSDPMTGWSGLGTFSNTEIPAVIKQDAQTFFQTLPNTERRDSEEDHQVTYWEDGHGQHAVILDTPHDGERWHYALIYDRDNRRIKVLKYSVGGYGITDASRCSDVRLARTQAEGPSHHRNLTTRSSEQRLAFTSFLVGGSCVASLCR